MKLFGKSNLESQSGQSTVEFVLTLILFLAFLLFYFQLNMIMAFGSYVHYATFMSARAYLSAGKDPDSQRTRARDVIVQTLKKSTGMSGIDKFPSIAKGFGGGDPGGFQVDPPSQYNSSIRTFSWMQGVRYTFKSKLFLIPLAGLGKASAQDPARDPAVNSVTMTAESWLGREPSYIECVGDMSKGNWTFDNGC